MFERFTDRARRVVVLAQEEARLLGHNSIGSEHLLLAMLDEGEGVAAKVLTKAGVTRDLAAAVIVERTEHKVGPAPGHMPFDPDAKRIFELSLREALQLGHNYIGTEHLLLGFVRNGSGVGVEVVIHECGVDLSRLRQWVIEVLCEHDKPRKPEQAPKPQDRSYRPVVVECPDCGAVVSDMAAHNEWHDR